MTARRLGVFADGSPEWHAARAGRIGGSDIGVVMGWSPFETRDDLLARKAGQLEPLPETDAMRRGTWCEPAVIQFLCHKHKLMVDPQAIGTWQHPELDWAIYNPDAVSRDNVLLEAKTTSDRTEAHGWGRAGTDEVPLTYLAQTIWGLGILGATECRLGVLQGAHEGKPNLSFSSYRIRFDAELFTDLLDAGQTFIDDLQALTKENTNDHRAA